MCAWTCKCVRLSLCVDVCTHVVKDAWLSHSFGGPTPIPPGSSHSRESWRPHNCALEMRQDSRKLGKCLGKWNGETETRKLDKVKQFQQFTAS